MHSILSQNLVKKKFPYIEGKTRAHFYFVFLVVISFQAFKETDNLVKQCSIKVSNRRRWLPRINNVNDILKPTYIDHKTICM